MIHFPHHLVLALPTAPPVLACYIQDTSCHYFTILFHHKKAIVLHAGSVFRFFKPFCCRPDRCNSLPQATGAVAHTVKEARPSLTRGFAASKQ